MKKSILIGSGLIVAGLLSAAVPTAVAQTDEEIIVTGRYGQVPESLRSLSQSVSYADLDLSTKAGRAELRHRVSLTARYLCDRLGESATATLPGTSCREAATRDAMSRVGTVEEGFAPRGTGWVAAPPWKAPYPPAWVETYP